MNFHVKTQLPTGHALGIRICGCSLFYKRELWASKSAGAHSTKSFKISGWKRWYPKDLRVRAPAAPVLTHSLLLSQIFCKTGPHKTSNATQEKLSLHLYSCILPMRLWQCLVYWPSLECKRNLDYTRRSYCIIHQNVLKFATYLTLKMAGPNRVQIRTSR